MGSQGEELLLKSRGPSFAVFNKLCPVCVFVSFQQLWGWARSHLGRLSLAEVKTDS